MAGPRSIRQPRRVSDPAMLENCARARRHAAHRESMPSGRSSLPCSGRSSTRGGTSSARSWIIR